MRKLIFVMFLTLGALAATAHAQAGDAAKQQAIQAGQQVYIERCMQCHSLNKDQMLLGPSLWGEMTKSPHKKTAAQIRVLIKTGKGKMPPWKDILSEDDISNVLAYLRTM